MTGWIALSTQDKRLADEYKPPELSVNHCDYYQPQTGDFISSDTPKDSAPMKSLRVVRSQSQTSTDRRRSLSVAFSLLHTHTFFFLLFQIASDPQVTWHYAANVDSTTQHNTGLTKTTQGLTNWRSRSIWGWGWSGWSWSSSWSRSWDRGWAWAWRRGRTDR